MGAPVATLPGAWCCRVSTGTGHPGVGILWLGEVESLICNFCLSQWVWQHIQLSEQIHPWDTLTYCWDVKQPTNRQTKQWDVTGNNLSKGTNTRVTFSSLPVMVEFTFPGLGLCMGMLLLCLLLHSCVLAFFVEKRKRVRRGLGRVGGGG